MNERETKPNSPDEPTSAPKDFLLIVMNDQQVAMDIRIKAAVALMPYFHVELGQDPGE